MATYDGTAGSVHKTLTANVADLVEFHTDASRVEVLYRDGPTDDPIYFWVDRATDPAIEGDGTQVVMKGSALIVESVSGKDSNVRLKCAGAAKYSTRIL